MVKEFKAFLLRGNVVDLAVGIVLGAAFGAVVTSLVDNILNPLLGLVTGGADFSDRVIEISDDTVITYGTFLNSVISFVTIGAGVFFLVVKPVNALTARSKKEPVDETVRVCTKCLSTIPVEAKRCAYCTSPQ